MKFARHASGNEHTSAMSPQAVGSGVTLSTISEFELGLSLASESALLPGTGATLSLPHTSANMTNRLTFQIGEMRTNVEFVARIYAIKQSDTALLAHVLIYRLTG